VLLPLVSGTVGKANDGYGRYLIRDGVSNGGGGIGSFATMTPVEGFEGVIHRVWEGLRGTSRVDSVSPGNDLAKKSGGEVGIAMAYKVDGGKALIVPAVEIRGVVKDVVREVGDILRGKRS
jgi:hypothetical protein